MRSVTRRELLVRAGQGVVAAALASTGRGVGAARGAAWPLPLAPRPDAGKTADLAELVRWVRDVPHPKVVAQAIDRIRGGVPLERLYAATILAGIENVEPRPVGFRFHCVMVMQPVWAVAQALPERERALPLIYALDDFKRSQQRGSSSPWTLRTPQTTGLPPADQARAGFIEACENWDVEAADAAVTVLARTATRDEIVEAFAPFAMRNFAAVGHHPIAVANAFRTLDVIGWGHAEPVLRSLVLGLLSTGPSDDSALFEDSKAAHEELRAKGYPRSAPPAALADTAAEDLPDVLRRGSSKQAVRWAMERAWALQFEAGGAHADACWRPLERHAAELLMQTPGLLAVHATTGVRALRWLAESSQDPRTRLLGLLQAAAALPIWRWAFAARSGPARDVWLPPVSAAAAANGKAPIVAPAAPAAEELLADLGSDREAAAKRLVLRLGTRQERDRFLAAARRLLLAKGREAHDWKFFVALEEVVTRPTAPDAVAAQLLAAGCHYLRDAKEPDYSPVAEARAALAV